MRRRRGFTLLEVMMATAVLAVGTISVLMVFGTGISFAHRRQAQQQLTQVLQEARTDARALVNGYRAPKGAASSAAGGAAGGAANTLTFPGGAEPETQTKASTVFSAYSYRLRFDPVRREVPEAGWRTSITVTWAGDKTYQESLVITPDVIPDEEFATSKTYEEERAGIEAAGTREKRN